MTSRKKDAGKYHHGDLRQALVDETLAMVRETGPDDFTLRKVARRLGVTHAAPYRHFPDRASLLAEVATGCMHDLREALAAAAEAARDAGPIERFAQVGKAYVRFALARPAEFRLMFGPEVSDREAHPGLGAEGDRAFAVVLLAASACIEAELTVERDPLRLAVTAWSAVHGLSMLIVNGQIPQGVPVTLDELLDAVTDQIWRGLKG